MERSPPTSGRPATPADIYRNGRPASIGTGGRHQSECPAGIIGIRNVGDPLATYLQHPWLRLPALDWIFLDMLLTSELCSFGEEIKRQGLLSNRRYAVTNDYNYLNSGNLAAMRKINWPETLGIWGFVLIAKLVLLSAMIGAIVWAFYHSHPWWGLGLAGFTLLYNLAWWTYRLSRWLVWRVRGCPDPRKEWITKTMRLWQAMHRVWKMLDSRIVNPTVLRQEMQQTTEQGVVWPQGAWALIDRVIAADPAVLPRRLPS